MFWNEVPTNHSCILSLQYDDRWSAATFRATRIGSRQTSISWCNMLAWKIRRQGCQGLMSTFALFMNLLWALQRALLRQTSWSKRTTGCETISCCFFSTMQMVVSGRCLFNYLRWWLQFVGFRSSAFRLTIPRKSFLHLVMPDKLLLLAHVVRPFGILLVVIMILVVIITVTVVLQNGFVLLAWRPRYEGYQIRKIWCISWKAGLLLHKARHLKGPLHLRSRKVLQRIVTPASWFGVAPGESFEMEPFPSAIRLRLALSSLFVITGVAVPSFYVPHRRLTVLWNSKTARSNDFISL